MKSKTIRKILFAIFLTVFISNIFFSTCNVFALNNGPNYDGNSYSYENPDYPRDYIIFRTIDTGEEGDYGSHDWFADGVLRTLRSSGHNPDGYNDWDWLLSGSLATQKYPEWTDSYANANGNHYAVRSFFTYLYATQLPDVDKSGEGGIYIVEEDVNIKNVKKSEAGGDSGVWVAQPKTQHKFYFEVIEVVDGVYGFSQVPPYVLPKKAQLLGDQAIKCISNTASDPNDPETKVSAMKPEGGAAWLGAMTHYYADLVVPAHLLNIKNYHNVYDKYYHNWFENQLGQLTLWDQYGNSGPTIDDIKYDRDVSTIKPMRPDIAATTFAVQAIEISYRSDGNHQHKENDPNSGLYINSSDRGGKTGEEYMKNWDWDYDIGENGDDSIHRYFYDKVERLLGQANYYCACAMQWVYDEAQKKLKEEAGSDVPDPNGMIKFPPEHPLDQTPLPEPFEKEENDKSVPVNNLGLDIKNAAMLAPILAIAFVPLIIKTLKKKEVRLESPNIG